jgi:hypothetical protein
MIQTTTLKTKTLCCRWIYDFRAQEVHVFAIHKWIHSFIVISLIETTTGIQSITILNGIPFVTWLHDRRGTFYTHSGFKFNWRTY